MQQIFKNVRFCGKNVKKMSIRLYVVWNYTQFLRFKNLLIKKHDTASWALPTELNFNRFSQE